jgi:hypothetical protein
MAKVPGIKCKFSLKTSQAVFEAGALRQVIAEVQDGFVVLRLRGLSNAIDSSEATDFFDMKRIEERRSLASGLQAEPHMRRIAS